MLFGEARLSRSRHATSVFREETPRISSRKSCIGDASPSVCKAGINRCSTSVKSVPNGNNGNKPASAAGLSARLISVRRIVAHRSRAIRKSRCDLAGVLGLPQQFVLKARVGDRQHRGDHLAVAFAANIGNAVFGNDHVTQVARDRGMAIAPADVGLILALVRRVSRAARSPSERLRARKPGR